MKWRDEEELNIELVDKLFRDNLAGANSTEDVKGATLSSPIAVGDMSQDSVELSIYRRQSLENNLLGVIDELNVSGFEKEAGSPDTSLVLVNPSTEEGEGNKKDDQGSDSIIDTFIKLSASAVKIQCAWRRQMAKLRMNAVRGSLAVSGQTAVTILQKWLHIAKINLRIKKVDENWIDDSFK